MALCGHRDRASGSMRGRLESRTAATSSLVGRIVGDVFFTLIYMNLRLYGIQGSDYEYERTFYKGSLIDGAQGKPNP